MTWDAYLNGFSPKAAVAALHQDTIEQNRKQSASVVTISSNMKRRDFLRHALAAGDPSSAEWSDRETKGLPCVPSSWCRSEPVSS